MSLGYSPMFDDEVRDEDAGDAEMTDDEEEELEDEAEDEEEEGGDEPL